MTPPARALGLALWACLAAGCSGDARKDVQLDPKESVLQEVADLLRSAAPPGGRGPSKAADLARFEGTFPRAHQAVRSGDVVVLWGTPMLGEGEAGADGVMVAYEKVAPAQGGYVLFTNGTTKKLSADEFKAAPKGVKK